MLGDELDREFSARFEQLTGPLERELDPAERPEPLWEFFRGLEKLPVKRDSRSPTRKFLRTFLKEL